MSDQAASNPLRRLAAVTLAAAVSTMLAGCNAAPHERVVSTTTVETPPRITLRPPAPRSELIPPAPNDRVVWNPGRWNWNGQAYLWISGRYVERPYRQAVWKPGRWTERGDAWVWDEGHWRG